MDISAMLVSLLKGITSLGQKIYDVINYSVDISWVGDVLNFFGAEVSFPDSVSLLGLIFSIGAIPLAAIIIYSIFKP